MSACAQALLRTLGGDAITVRFAASRAGGDEEELGLGSPEFRDVVVRPALVRVQAGRVTVLLDAATAEAALQTGQVKEALLASSFVLVHGEPMRVEAVERHTAFGRAYLYRLLLVAEGRQR